MACLTIRLYVYSFHMPPIGLRFRAGSAVTAIMTAPGRKAALYALFNLVDDLVLNLGSRIRQILQSAIVLNTCLVSVGD